MEKVDKIKTFLRNEIDIDLKTKNDNFLRIFLSCCVLGLSLFVSIYVPFFVYVTLVLGLIFVICTKSVRKLYYLIFLVPLLNIFRVTSEEPFDRLILYVFIVFFVFMAFRFIFDLILKQKKIDWLFTITCLLAAIYFIIIFDINKITYGGSFLIGCLMIFFVKEYKNEIDAKGIGLIFILGLMFSIFIGLFSNTSVRLQELIGYGKGGAIGFFAMGFGTESFCGEIAIALAFLFTLHINKKIGYLFYIVYSVLLIVSILTLSKFMFLMTAVLIAIYLILYIIKNRKDKAHNIILNVILMVLITSVVCLIFNRQMRATDESGFDNFAGVSLSERLSVWQSYFDRMFSNIKNILIGNGVGAGLFINEPHNTFIQLIYYVGFLGFLLLVLSYLFAFRPKDIKRVNWYNIIPILVSLTVLILTDSFNFIFNVYILLGLVYLFYDNKYDKEYNGQKKERVLHFLSTSSYSGAENVVCQIINMFDGEIEMAYCSPKGAIKQQLKDRAPNVKYVEIKKLSLIEIFKAIRKYQPTIIHGHDLKAMTMVAISPFSGKKMGHCHGNDKDNMKKVSPKSIVYLLDYIFLNHLYFVSKSCYEEYYFKRLIRKKSSILYNIINIDEVKSKAESDKKSYNYDLVYLGRLSYPKNPVRLIEIASRLKKVNKKFKFAIIGDGEFNEKLKQKIIDEKLEKNVFMLGYLNNAYKIVKDSKLMLMTSYYEGTPMCALESLALGTPIVSTPTDGLLDLIENGKTGYIYNSDKEAVECICKILNNENALRDKCIDFSIEYNDIEKYKSELKKNYN